MRHTLVAAFATLTDANRTRGDLMARGIPREQIHAVGAETADIHAYDAPYSTTDSPLDRTHHESRVAHFFKSLFGNEPHEEHRRYATAYPDAIRRGALVIAVDVTDEDQLIRARDALEYNGALNIHESGAGNTDTAAAHGYAGPTSPYAGATGGDSHLDKHFADPGTRTAAHAPRTTGESLGASTDYGDRSSADTGHYDIGGAAKRAGTDYPATAATTAPTGAGTTGHGTSADLGASQAGTCSDRVCVIRRPG
ncbi:hypothetical protein [Stutzerimonas nitrititolerans]|uniref:hypothetical protein n=1 Tax=Stutzerimonas nitrititolerans TaxID=2482751 RepID=UPI00289CFCFC|nr:hypothetical protein [Stutzerimonas nitrititolerans]